jgi:hypothetical protein
MNFDLLSFLAGVAAGFLLFAISRLLSKYVPRFVSAVIIRIRNYQELNTAAIEKKIKAEAYQRAQNAHICSSLFSLNEILIPTQVIPPPKNTLNNQSEPPYSPTDLLIPFTPGYTELASVFPITKIPLHIALQNGANCVLIGPAGSGKTVALADLVSQICFEPQSNPNYAGLFPIYLHVYDLEFTADTPGDPIAVLQDALNKKNLSISNTRFHKFFQAIVKDPKRRILLVLDGMDELSPEAAQPCFDWIGKLIHQLQHIQIITTANPEYTGSLLSLAFHPLGLTTWGQTESEKFVCRWKEQWLAQVNPKEDPQYPNKFHYNLIANWLQREKLFLSPLEWTMIVWSACAGDTAGATALHAMEAYVSRLTQKSVPRSALENLAGSMINSQQLFLTIQDVERIFSKHRPQQIQSEKMSFLQEEQPIEDHPIKKVGKEKRISSKEVAVDTLLEAGLICQFNGERLAFKNALVPGYLASFSENVPEFFAEGPILWCGQQSAMRYYAAQNKHTDEMLHFLAADKTPLVQNLLIIGHWLNTSKKYPWREKIFERLGYLLAVSELPKFQLAKIASTLLTSNDPSIHLLFMQLLNSQKPQTRQVAALAVAALGIDKSTNKLVSLLEDPDTDVRLSASLALTQLDNPHAKQVVEQVINHADEDQRVIVAEAAAELDHNNLDRIQSYLQSEDMLTRRAALGALLKVDSDKSIPIAESVFTEDSQWIIRNMAAQLLECYRNPVNPFAPERLSKAGETSWLIEYAGDIGQGISPDIIPYDVLLHAVQNGDADQQRASMEYLAQVRDPKIVSLYEEMVNSPGTAGREEAAYHLWLHSTKDFNHLETLM